MPKSSAQVTEAKGTFLHQFFKEANKQNMARTGRKIEMKKNFLPNRSNPTRVRKFKNKSKKIVKIKKHHPGFISRRNGPSQAEK